MTLEEKALEHSLKINGFTKEDCYNEKGELFQFIKSDMDIYLAGAKELEQENNKLLDVINNQDVKIADLENTCKDKDRQLDNWYKEWQKQDKQIEQAKEIIKNIIRVTWNEGWNYSLDVKVKAEQFLKE